MSTENVSYSLDGYEFKPSLGPTKYDVYSDGKYMTSFGVKQQPQFHDRIGHYSEYDTYNEALRDYHYSSTRKGVEEESPEWFENTYLWSD